MSSANGTSAVDHVAPDRVTSFGGPSPSNDRITTQGSREAIHSAPAATTSSSWAMTIGSRPGRESAIAPGIGSGQRLGRGDRIQHRARLVGGLGEFVGTIGVGDNSTPGLDIGGAVAHE